MNKKILALALAILFIATAFTACKKGPELTEINGKEYPVVKDDNGEMVVNDDNQIAVLVTDRNNEVLTYENGENQTHWVQITGPLVLGDKIQTKDSSLAIPEGWTGEEISGKVIKNNTDGKCYIQVMRVAELEDERTLESYLERIDAQNNAIAEAFSDEEQMNLLAEKNPAFAEYKGCKYTVAMNDTMLLGKNAYSRVNKIVNKDGKLVYYAENYYFTANEGIYKLDYICLDGKGYDESFSFRNYVSEGFTFDEKKN